jgi:WD40 repeat protein
MYSCSLEKLSVTRNIRVEGHRNMQKFKHFEVASHKRVTSKVADPSLTRPCLQLLSTTQVPYSATSAGLAPDGKEAAVGASDGKVRVYKVSGDSLVEEAVLEKHRGPITAVRYSPDGALIATADQNREAVVWDRVSREV